MTLTDVFPLSYDLNVIVCHCIYVSIEGTFDLFRQYFVFPTILPHKTHFGPIKDERLVFNELLQEIYYLWTQEKECNKISLSDAYVHR